MNGRFWRFPGRLQAVLPLFASLLLAALFVVAGVRRARAQEVRLWWRELALAREAEDPAATGELAHRLVPLPGTVESDRELAEACLEASNWSDLAVVLDRLIAAGPGQEAFVLHLTARRLAATEDHAGAAVAWSRLLHRTDLPLEQQRQAWEGLGAAQEALGNWDEADAAVNHLISLGDSAEARVWRVRLLVQRRSWDDLLTEAQVLKSRFPSHRETAAVLPRLERVLRELDGLLAAENEVTRSPAALAPRLQRAVIESHAGLWRLAAEDFRSVAAQNPRVHAACLLASEIGLGDRESLAGFHGDKTTRLPWLASSKQLADYETELDRHADAWEALKDVTYRIIELPVAHDLTPAVAALVAQQAVAEYQLGWTRLADADAREALAVAPAAWEAKWVRARVLASRHQVGRALSLLESCRAGAPWESATVPSLVQETAAGWLQALGRHEEAIKVYTSCLERERRPDLLRARSKSLEILGRTGEAQADLKAALEEAALDVPAVEDDAEPDPETLRETDDEDATESAVEDGTEART